MDPVTKLLLGWEIGTGKRTVPRALVADLAQRVDGPVQLPTAGLKHYYHDIDLGGVVFRELVDGDCPARSTNRPRKKVHPATYIPLRRELRALIEHLHKTRSDFATMENQVALWAAWRNWITVRPGNVTPAMTAGLATVPRDGLWLAGLLEQYAPPRRKPGPKKGAKYRPRRRPTPSTELPVGGSAGLAST